MDMGKFIRREPKLKKYIYDCSASRHSIDSFINITNEIALYVGSKHTTGPYIRTTIEKLERPARIGRKPTTPMDETGTTKTMDEIEFDIYKEDIKAYSALQKTFDTQLRQVYNVIWGQCTMDMESKIRAHDTYQLIEKGGEL